MRLFLSRHHAIVMAALCAIASDAPRAQAPAGPRAGDPAFEVASIKKTAGRQPFMDASGGRYVASNVPAEFLIQTAYDVAQIIGGPRWIETDHFDVMASRGGLGVEQVPAMMRHLLADRFKFKAHFETREVPTYTLVAARNDKTLGPRLTRASCDASGPNGDPSPCKTEMARPGLARATGETMPEIASLLTGILGRVVIDKTGLDGTYDLELTWTPDQPRSADARVPDTDGGSVFSALQEQLGLKLAGGRGTVDVLVIDSISPPREN
jgi:uncharacterized protein (TIGR03435 family)